MGTVRVPVPGLNLKFGLSTNSELTVPINVDEKAG
jgi:hypothetical protein